MRVGLSGARSSHQRHEDCGRCGQRQHAQDVRQRDLRRRRIDHHDVAPSTSGSSILPFLIESASNLAAERWPSTVLNMTISPEAVLPSMSPAMAITCSSVVLPLMAKTPVVFTAPEIVTRWLLYSLTSTLICGELRYFSLSLCFRSTSRSCAVLPAAWTWPISG